MCLSGIMTCASERHDAHRGQCHAVRLCWREEVIRYVTQCNEEQRQERHDVTERDPKVETEGLYEHVVDEDSGEGHTDVSEAHVEHDSGVRVLGLVVVHCRDEAVVRQEKACPTHD